MEKEPDSTQHSSNEISHRTIISFPLSSLYYVAAGLCSAIWLAIRLWIGGVEGELRALHTALSAEEVARIQNGTRISTLESAVVGIRAEHRNYDQGFEAAWRKFDRIEDDRWNSKKTR